MNLTVLHKYKSFILGKCNCGCNEDIPLYNFGAKKFRRFKKEHINKNRRQPKFVKISSSGYLVIWNPVLKKHEKVHRLVYEAYYQCCLLEWTVIHHIDGNRQNNDITNLMPIRDVLHLYLEQTNARYIKSLKKD